MIFSEFKWKRNHTHFYAYYIKEKKRQHEYVQEKTIPDIRSQLCLIIENIWESNLSKAPCVVLKAKIRAFLHTHPFQPISKW